MTFFRAGLGSVMDNTMFENTGMGVGAVTKRYEPMYLVKDPVGVWFGNIYPTNTGVNWT